MLTDVEIAQSAKMKPIVEVAQKVGLDEDDLELYGKYKAKISLEAIKKLDQNEDGKLILVTAINPTPAGEGKTTTMIGLSQALNKLGKKSVVAMREPSLGPCFGIKGGAAGGGYAQVVPMEDINLHFTGDIHAITAANNLIAAMLDNSIHQGNPLNIDVRQIVWKRVVDLNDRALRHTVCGLGGKVNGVPREDGFDITVASEVMAILCLATSLEDLKQRAAKMIVAYTYDGKPVTVDDIEATGAVTLLLKDAIKPNLVQTLDHTPVFVHGGPFANIAHGCNSVMATQLAIKLGDYAITEAGFGADLGAEKFLDIKCRQANLNPEAVVIVATVRALKMHGGVAKKDLGNENLEALKAGLGNLEKHIENIAKFDLPCIVAINAFPTDTEAELQLLNECCKKLGVEVAISKVWEKGADGGIELAEKLLESAGNLNGLYNMSVQELMQIKGIGKAKAVQICCILELSRRIAKQKAREKLDFSNAETIAGYYMEDMRHLEKEHLILVMLDNRCRLIRDKVLSVGTSTGSMVSVREIFKEALDNRAASIVLLHNHPSGNPSPSREDMKVTRNVAEAGKIVGIELLDHIVIGDNSYFSFKQMQYIN